MKYIKVVAWGLVMALASRIILILISALMGYIAGVGSLTLDITTAYFVIVVIAIIVAMCMKIRDENHQPISYNHVTAGLLAIFLGSLGAHKFYCRKYTWAVVFVLFAGTGIPFVSGLIEGIVYLLMDDEKFNRSIQGTSF